MMSTTGDNNDTCANCGKEGSNLNTCNRCKLVKYCNAACKKKHRSKHKKKCDRRVAEIHDEALFKQPPQKGDCPICFLRLPTLGTGSKYKSCCGNVICSGCIYAVAKMDGNADELCPFCRAPTPTSDEEGIKQTQKRMEVGDAQAMDQLGRWYQNGDHGLPQDRDKALELWLRAGELGCFYSHFNIGVVYKNGHGVERDEMKAKHYYELAAMGRDENARHNLGNAEFRAGSFDRALKHYMIAAGGGSNQSLKTIQQMYSKGYATRDDYAKALQAYQAYLEEIKSDQRDKAAAFDDVFEYYE